MTLKFDPNYRLYVDTVNSTLDTQTQRGQAKSVIIAPPITLEFEVVRNTLASVNQANITVYNLSLEKRTLIRKDIVQTKDYRPVELWAGYGSDAGFDLGGLVEGVTQLPRIFRGNVTRAYSYRSGVNFLTKLVCQDAGYAAVNAIFNQNYKAGTPYRQVIMDMVLALPTIKLGAIGNFQGTLERANTYVGDPRKLLNSITGGYFYVDGERGYALTNNEYLKGKTPRLDDTSGILGVPVKDNAYVTVEMLFEPTIYPSQTVTLQTGTVPYYNGLYKVVGITHKGTISPAVSGVRTTTLILSKLDPTTAQPVVVY